MCRADALLQFSPVELKVIKLDSTQTLLPFRYYDLPFCKPEGGVKDMIDNLGEILVGDRIENSRYDIDALVDVKCRTLCVQKYTAKEMEKFRSHIAEDYRAHWMVDGLPAAYNKHTMLVEKSGKETLLYAEGFPIGGEWLSSFQSKRETRACQVAFFDSREARFQN